MLQSLYVDPAVNSVSVNSHYNADCQVKVAQPNVNCTTEFSDTEERLGKFTLNSFLRNEGELM